MSYLSAAGHRLEYRWVRPPQPLPGDRPTLVFLHEGLGSVALWKRFPEAVARATQCRALVYSRYGHGKSDLLAEARAVDYMHHEALAVLPEILEALQIESPVLIGHSDGASIALIHAGGAQRPVRGAVVMAPHVFVEDITVDSIAQARVAFETTDLRNRLARYHDHPDRVFRGWSDIWLHADFRAWNIEAYLPKIACPLLVIQGAGDHYGTLAQVDAIERQAGAPVEKLVLDCDHSPQTDRPAETVAAIARFVEGLIDQPA